NEALKQDLLGLQEKNPDALKVFGYVENIDELFRVTSCNPNKSCFNASFFPQTTTTCKSGTDINEALKQDLLGLQEKNPDALKVFGYV
ncbi:hypothetical protein ACT453_51360, partial [Bacillus sp. D-CC]